MSQRAFSHPCIAVCENGCVHLRFGPAQVVLPPEDFRQFVRHAQWILSRLDSDGADAPRGGFWQ